MMLVCIPLTARVSVSSQRKTATDYEFSRHGVATNVIVDGNDYLLVRKAAQLFADDLGCVTGTHGIVSAKVSDKKVGTVIVGTIHHSEWIDRLVKAGKGAFYTHPESKVVADSFGNLFTTSHCEPLLYDNASEWKVKTMSDWNYLNNRQGIIDQLCKRVEEAALYDNIYTLALRGIHDGKMKGIPRDKEVSVVQQGIDDQRDILSKYLKKHPRIFR